MCGLAERSLEIKSIYIYTGVDVLNHMGAASTGLAAE